MSEIKCEPEIIETEVSSVKFNKDYDIHYLKDGGMYITRKPTNKRLNDFDLFRNKMNDIDIDELFDKTSGFTSKQQK